MFLIITSSIFISFVFMITNIITFVFSINEELVGKMFLIAEELETQFVYLPLEKTTAFP